MTTPMATSENEPLLRVEHVRKTYGQAALGKRRREQAVTVAVDDVSFDLFAGETLGLVGETGCGKSTIARSIMGLSGGFEGSIRVAGVETSDLSPAGWRRLRRELQMVFQDASGSIDPRMSVLTIVREPLDIHEIGNRHERDRAAIEALEHVGLPARFARRRPHQLSGGQRQRVAIARALVVRPRLVVLDEPVSALDVSVQAQVLNLLTSLQQDLHLTYLFITHDLGVAEFFCDRVAVLYQGRIVEQGESAAIFNRPTHPYTQALVAAVPTIGPPGAPQTQMDQ